MIVGFVRRHFDDEHAQRVDVATHVDAAVRDLIRRGPGVDVRALKRNAEHPAMSNYVAVNGGNTVH